MQNTSELLKLRDAENDTNKTQLIMMTEYRKRI